jgi:hypothetical protein
MSESGRRINVRAGDVSDSQIVVGDQNRVSSVRQSVAAPTPAELDALARELAELRTRVAAEAPAEQQQAAVTKIEELAEAVQQPEPDLDTMAAVRNWFAKRLPALAGAVTSVIVNPIVGKLVESAGDALAGEFRRRFPQAEKPPAG